MSFHYFPLRFRFCASFLTRVSSLFASPPPPDQSTLLFIPLGLPKTWPLPGSGSHSFPSFIREGTAGLLSSQKSPLGPKLAPRLLAHFLDPRHHLSPCSHWATRHLNFFVFLGLHPQHMKVPRLGFTSELQLPAYTPATATPDPSRVYDLHHSSQQRRILKPLSKARDGTCILVEASQILFH